MKLSLTPGIANTIAKFLTSTALTLAFIALAPLAALAEMATLTASPGSRINVRDLPSTTSPIRHYGLPGDRVEIITSVNSNSDGRLWYQVLFPRTGARGWVRGDLVRPDSSAPPSSFQPQRVSFAPGSSAATVGGRVQGGQVRDYILNARAGQTMSTSITGTSPFLQVIVMQPNSRTLYTGSGNWSGVLPASGDYYVRVRIVPEEQANASGEYSLTISIR
ncbi:SH3 domain-containing protein [Thermoleptolyngbya oregonensis NK1-22]|uniref:SH3 domain-containing protein n=1 Tax=Thermoleptolyngbya oregonensis NK1-22 TaxID=2547457 RepID=A0AA97BCG7_9CYAN|nr:SH3 domain-containing protein [Thermoleptolyngbya oregonensis NK1-22]